MACAAWPDSTASSIQSDVPNTEPTSDREPSDASDYGSDRGATGTSPADRKRARTRKTRVGGAALDPKLTPPAPSVVLRMTIRTEGAAP